MYLKKIKERKIIKLQIEGSYVITLFSGQYNTCRTTWRRKKLHGMSTALWKTWVESFWATALLKNTVVHLYEKNLSIIFWYMFYLNSTVENCTETCCSQLLQKIPDMSTSFSSFLTTQEQCLNYFLDNVIGAAGRWHCHCLKFMVKPVKNIFHSFFSLLAVHFYSRISHLTLFLHILCWNQYRVGIQFAKVFKPNICLELTTYTDFFLKRNVYWIFVSIICATASLRKNSLVINASAQPAKLKESGVIKTTI